MNNSVILISVSKFFDWYIIGLFPTFPLPLEYLVLKKEKFSDFDRRFKIFPLVHHWVISYFSVTVRILGAQKWTIQ